jgi:hypothetical protein
LSEPALKKRKRLGGKIAAAKTAFRVFTAQMRDLLQFVVIRHDVWATDCQWVTLLCAAQVKISTLRVL